MSAMAPFSLLYPIPCSCSHAMEGTGGERPGRAKPRSSSPHPLCITISRGRLDDPKHQSELDSTWMPDACCFSSRSSPTPRFHVSSSSFSAHSSRLRVHAPSSSRSRIDSPSRRRFRICSLSPSLSFHHFNPEHLQHDALCTLAILAGSYGWIKIFDMLVAKKFIEQKFSRKLIHISTGVMYVMAWPLFSASPWARFFAVSVPLSNVLKLIVYGTGILKDEGLVKSISRMGTSKELLRGPLYYVLVLSMCTVFFWRESPVGMVGLATMCGGDGIADIVGRRMGSIKLPYNPKKSWAGSVSMFVFSFLLSISLLYYYSSLGFFSLDWRRAIEDIAMISLVATFVESLPLPTVFDDNITVPFVSILLGIVFSPAFIS